MIRAWATMTVLLPSLAFAQHGAHGAPPAAEVEPHAAAARPIPHEREASGTAWAPDGSPLFGWHVPLGDWRLMLHGNLFAGVTAQGSDRGATEAFSTNWAMGMASGPVPGGELGLRAMLSAEPWTVANGGYPLLLQTGESFEDEPLRDRQHPHDLFMELAATYTLDLSRELQATLYAALPGEPALGPPAYPHRASAFFNPAAPIGHHWQDATHIAFGVVTAGLQTRSVRLEGTVFNGREPDDERAGIETNPLTSWGGRLQVALGPFAAQISAAHLDEPERLHPGEDVERYTASLLWNRPLARRGNVALAAVWGANDVEDTFTSSGLLEGSWIVPGERHVLVARAELLGKSGEELVLPEALHDEVYTVGELTLGYLLEFPEVGFVVPGIGFTGTMGFVPDGLDDFYGTGLPVGTFVFVHLRPPRLPAGGH